MCRCVIVPWRFSGIAARINDDVLPGVEPEEPLSDDFMLALLWDMHPDVTVHGFRSTFKDWAIETTALPIICRKQR